MKIDFRKSDFIHFQYSYIFTNETSGTEYRDYLNIKPQTISDQEITLKVLNNSCNVGHNLMVMILQGDKPKIPKNLPKEGRGRGIHFSAIAKVLEKNIHETEKDYCYVKLRFTQYDKHSWDDILEDYKKKQDSVLDTIKKIKVHEN